MTFNRHITDAEYAEIESSLNASRKGAAFLRLYARKHKNMSVNSIRRILREEIAAKIHTPQSTTVPAHLLRQELLDMSGRIQQMRAEIAELRPVEGVDSRISSATGELGAIVTLTERATSSILNSAEQVQSAASRLPDTGSVPELRMEIENEVTEILVACSFQDIAGQRTTKVVNTLRYLENRLTAVLELLEMKELPARQTKRQPEDRRPDAHLLNGPPLDGGISQEEADALFDGSAPAPVTIPAPESKPVAAAAEPMDRDDLCLAEAAMEASETLGQDAIDSLFD